MHIKNYEELSIADNFMFCKVFSTRLDLSREIIEIILDRKIKKVKSVVSEKTVQITSDAKSIRLDIFLDDENGSVYDLEMQVAKEEFLSKRARYYQSLIDLECLEKGASYDKLPDSIVIFICHFDYFGLGLPVYAFENICGENKELSLGDGTLKVVVNLTADTSKSSDRVKNLFRYFSEGIISDRFTEKLDAAVDKVRLHKEWKVEYMEWRANEMRHSYEKEAAVEKASKEYLAKGREEMKAENREILEKLTGGKGAMELIAEGYDKEQVEFADKFIKDLLSAGKT